MRDPRVLGRIRALAIPPARRQVWICRDPDVHLQAVGTDAAGRRQYRYHGVWRQKQDRIKFDRVTEMAERLPGSVGVCVSILGSGGWAGAGAGRGSVHAGSGVVSGGRSGV
ncbi:hypothetical protein [Nonomuraea sp. bgisy101]|uniref:hypothetical protein n=1 Tax=Nonomuraea sp. bgisy101 TaxID=3413784 RepID=UPI003D71ADDB